MIVLDTNVISESIRIGGAPAVRTWLDGQRREVLFLTATVAAELLFGVAALPRGKRQDGLRTDIYRILSRFSGRILPFDLRAAEIFAQSMAFARASGRTVSVGDGQIAATAMSQGFAVATRDVAAFQDTGVSVIDPWTAD